MREGLYDSLLTARLGDQLAALTIVTAQTHAVDEPDAPARFARFLAEDISTGATTGARSRRPAAT